MSKEFNASSLAGWGGNRSGLESGERVVVGPLNAAVAFSHGDCEDISYTFVDDFTRRLSIITSRTLFLVARAIRDSRPGNHVQYRIQPLTFAS